MELDSIHLKARLSQSCKYLESNEIKIPENLTKENIKELLLERLETLDVEKAKNDGLSTYVLTKGNQADNTDTLIKYSSNLSNEYSFISIASTFMPMSVMLKYYTEFSDNDLNQLINNIYSYFLLNFESSFISERMR